MELLAQKCDNASVANQAFLTGSLSLIDAYLNIEMKAFLEEVDLDEEMKNALLYGQGRLGELLK